MENYVLISGASEGIGCELAKIFAEHKYNLLLIARNTKKLLQLQTGLGADTDINIKTLTLDLSIPEAPQKILDFTKKNDIKIDILINNAGIGNYGNFLETDINIEKTMIDLNIRTLTEMCKLFLPSMINSGFGKIMNVASTAAFFPGPKMAVYYASKSYVLSFSEALNSELKKQNISVTALCPGPTASQFMTRANMGSSRLFNNPLMHLMSSQSVAEYGFKSLMKGKTVAVPGYVNKLLTISPRFFPKKIIRFIMGSIMAKR
jgi:short-subunit dehydrogenase